MVRLALAVVLATSATALAQTALSVSITRPADGARLKVENLGPRNTYSVAGRVSGGTEPYAVTVNGTDVRVNPENEFMHDTRLRAGRNTITVRVTDSAGASATDSATVNVVSESGGRDPRRWPSRPLTRKRCKSPSVGFGRVRNLRVARIACSRAARIVRATQRDHGRACSPPLRGGFSRCKAAGFDCYARYRGSRTQQYACVRGTRSAARWYLDF